MTASGRLRALVAEATPGPWEARGGLVTFTNSLRNKEDIANCGEGREPYFAETDATLIALAPQLAELLADMGEELAWYARPLAHPQEKARVKPLLARLDALFPEEEKNESWRSGLWRTSQ